MLRRRARQAQRDLLQLLPGAVHRHHVRGGDQAQDALLLLQPHRALRAHRLHGSARLHASARLRRETLVRYVHHYFSL